MTDQVFNAIHASIMSGDMPAGYRLRIRDLAAEVGTSAMPVREAIRRLEEAGLAVREPHKGAVVKGLSLSELAHIYDVRRLMEVEAARLGTAAITADHLTQLHTEYVALNVAIEARDPIGFLDHDEAFLAVLYDASGNPVLSNTIRTLWERCRAYKILGARATMGVQDVSPLWSFQAELLEAAQARDALRAALVTGESMGDATTRIREQLAAQGGSHEPTHGLSRAR